MRSLATKLFVRKIILSGIVGGIIVGVGAAFLDYVFVHMLLGVPYSATFGVVALFGAGVWLLFCLASAALRFRYVYRCAKRREDEWNVPADTIMKTVARLDLDLEETDDWSAEEFHGWHTQMKRHQEARNMHGKRTF